MKILYKAISHIYNHQIEPEIEPENMFQSNKKQSSGNQIYMRVF